MGNIGGIEKIMVFGILVIIVAILGIAFYSAIRVDDDLSSNRQKAAGQDRVIQIYDSVAVQNEEGDKVEREVKPLVADVMSPYRNRLSGSESLKANTTVNSDDRTYRESALGGALETEPFGGSPSEENIDDSGTNTGPPVYEVRKGDSLRKIARILCGDPERYTEIQALNPGVDPLHLQVGQKLIMPAGGSDKNLAAGNLKNSNLKNNPKASRSSGEQADRFASGDRTYVVQKGDTLLVLSRKFYGNNTAWKRIYEANREVIPHPDVLPIGLKLILP